MTLSLPDWLSWTTVLTVVVSAVELLSFCLIPVVILRTRQPLAAVSWVLGIILMPGLGSLLYLATGTTRVQRKARRKQQARQALDPQLPSLVDHEVPPPLDSAGGARTELMALANRICETRPTWGNQVEVITDTNRAYGLQEQAILDAKNHVHVAYYIFQPDETGRRYRDLLIAKAREGVTIRFMYDAVGSLRLNRRFLKPMRDAGIAVTPFLPVNPLRRRWVFNLRNHRKILVVDGRVGFTGGVNVGNEYIGRRSHFGYWRDTHMMIRGPAVLQLQQVFAQDWFFATDEELVAAELYPATSAAGDQTVQVIASGPDLPVEVCHELFFAAISSARRSVLIESCYFVPPESIRLALESAAHRGVDVQLILPARSAHVSALLAAHSYYEDLLASGVQIFEYMDGLMHSKVLSIDGEWSYVGSANMDNRSLRLNFEAGVVFYGPRMAAELEEMFRTDRARSRPLQLDRWSNRSILRRLAENTCRLLSPVL